MHEGYGGAGAVHGFGLSSPLSWTGPLEFYCSMPVTPLPVPPGPPSSMSPRCLPNGSLAPLNLPLLGP